MALREEAKHKTKRLHKDFQDLDHSQRFHDYSQSHENCHDHDHNHEDDHSHGGCAAHMGTFEAHADLFELAGIPLIMEIELVTYVLLKFYFTPLVLLALIYKPLYP